MDTVDMMDDLAGVVASYVKTKEEAEFYDRATKAYNEKIKQMMNELEITNGTFAGYKVLVSRVTHETLNEAKLLNALKTHYNGETALIKTREYVDMDLLEQMLYRGEIDAEMLSLLEACKECKPDTFTLRVTKLKEGGHKKA